MYVIVAGVAQRGSRWIVSTRRSRSRIGPTLFPDPRNKVRVLTVAGRTNFGLVRYSGRRPHLRGAGCRYRYPESMPETVALAMQLHDAGMSYRKISAELAAQGHVTGSGKPHVASAIQKMLVPVDEQKGCAHGLTGLLPDRAAHGRSVCSRMRELLKMPRNPTFVDRHVGARARAARLEAGKSQTDVAESLGLTFQQVQKYEKGTNRISAGKLHELSRLFDTPVQFFFDGMADAVSRRGSKGAAVLDPLTRFGGSSDGMKIVMAFEKADPALRRVLAQHVEDVVRLAGREKPRARG